MAGNAGAMGRRNGLAAARSGIAAFASDRRRERQRFAVGIGPTLRRNTGNVGRGA